MNKPLPTFGPGITCFPTRLIAGWQQALIWLAWLAVIGLCVVHSDTSSFTLSEFVAIIGASFFTWLCIRYPLGLPKVVITSPEGLRGEFVSRVNWAVVVISTTVACVGFAMCAKIIHDWWGGDVTIVGILLDMVLFLLNLFISDQTGGAAGNVTGGRFYILVFLLPFGLLIAWLYLLPLLYRGCRFRVLPTGDLEVLRSGHWQQLRCSDYVQITADGVSIDFHTSALEPVAVRLPQERVFSSEFGTHVDGEILATFIRQRVEQAGFQTAEPDRKGRWKYLREEPAQ